MTGNRFLRLNRSVNSQRTIVSLATIIVGNIALAVSACLIPWLVGFSDSVDDIPAGLVAFSQMSLLSLWVGFGRTQWPLKLISVLIAGLLLSTSIMVANRSNDLWFVAVGASFAPVPVIVVASLIVRKRWAEVHSFEGDTYPPGNRLQFSIAHMLSGMLAVSLALAVSRWLAAIQGRLSDIGTLATIVILWAFLCGSISLTSLWACLALGSVWIRLLFVLAFSVLGGPLVAFALGIELTRGLLMSVGLFVVTTIVNVTLLAVRWAGYRMTAREAESYEPSTDG